MTKENISVSVDEEVASYVSRAEINTSGLVNQLLENHMNAGGSKHQILEFRIDQVSSEIEALEGRLNSKKEELERLESRYRELESKEGEVLQKADKALEDTDLREKNRKANYWADELGVTVEELAERLDRI